MVSQPVQRVDQPGHRRGRTGPGGVPGHPSGRQPQVQRPALGGRDGVAADALVAALEPAEHPAALADRRLDPVEQLGVGLGQPPRPVCTLVLLVGDERDDDVALRPDALAPPAQQGGEGHRAHVLHVDGAASPDVPVAHQPAERVDAPVVGLGRHHVEVGVHEQAGQVRTHTGNAEHDVRAVRGVVAGQQPRCPADRLEAGGDPGGRLALTGAGAPAPVRRVEPDQCRQQVDDLRIRSGSSSRTWFLGGARPVVGGHLFPSERSCARVMSIVTGVRGDHSS